MNKIIRNLITLLATIILIVSYSFANINILKYSGDNNETTLIKTRTDNISYEKIRYENSANDLIKRTNISKSSLKNKIKSVKNERLKILNDNNSLKFNNTSKISKIYNEDNIEFQNNMDNCKEILVEVKSECNFGNYEILTVDSKSCQYNNLIKKEIYSCNDLNNKNDFTKNIEINNKIISIDGNEWHIEKNDYITKYINFEFVFVNPNTYQVYWNWNDEYLMHQLSYCKNNNNMDCIKKYVISKLDDKELNDYNQCNNNMLCESNVLMKNNIFHTTENDFFVKEYFENKTFSELINDLKSINKSMPLKVIDGDAEFIGELNAFNQKNGSFFVKLKNGIINSDGVKLKIGLNSLIVTFNNDFEQEDLIFWEPGNITRYLYIDKYSDIINFTLSLQSFEKLVVTENLSGEGNPYYLNGANSINIKNNVAIVTSRFDDSLSTYDISNPENLRLLDTIRSTGSPYYLEEPKAVNNNNGVFTLSDENDGLSSFDISNPSDIRFLDNRRDTRSPDYLDSPIDFTIQNNDLYVAVNGEDAIISFDVSNPRNIRSRDVIFSYDHDPIDGIYTLVAKNNYLYAVSVTHGSISSYNIANPNNIRPLDYAYVDEIFSDNIYINNNYAFVTFTDGIEIYDVSNPNNIRRVAKHYGKEFPIPFGSASLEFKDNLMYMGSNRYDGVAIYDIDDLHNIKLIDYVKDMDDLYNLRGIKDIKLKDNHIFAVSSKDDAFSVIGYKNVSKIGVFVDGFEENGYRKDELWNGKGASDIINLNSNDIEQYLGDCIPDFYGKCLVPIVFRSETPGGLKYSKLESWYDNYPFDVEIDVLDDEIVEWNNNRFLKSKKLINNITSILQSFLDNDKLCSSKYDYCNVPISISSKSKGKIRISDLNINYYNELIDYPNILYLNISNDIYVNDNFSVTAYVEDVDNINTLQITYLNYTYNMTYNKIKNYFYKNLTAPNFSGYQNILINAINKNNVTSSKFRDVLFKSNQPDLTLDRSNVKILSMKREEPSLVEFNITIQNNGITDAQFVDVLVNIGSNTLTKKLDVKSNSISSEIFRFYNLSNRINISIVIDPLNNILEYDETNNNYNETIVIPDTLKPEKPEFIGEYNNWTTMRTHEIYWSNAYDNDGISNYEIKVNGGNWIDVGLNQSFTKRFNKGINTVKVRAIDQSNNIGDYNEVEIKVDTTKPRKPMAKELNLGKVWTKNNQSFYLWTDPGDIGSGVVSYIAKINDQELYLKEDYLKLNLSSGIYEFRVRAVDAVNHTSLWSDKIVVYVDSTAPEITSVNSVTHPLEGEYYSNNKPIFEITSSDIESGVSSYYYLIDQQNNTIPDRTSLWTSDGVINFSQMLSNMNIVNNFTTREYGLSPGIWYLHVAAEDNVGNMGKAYHREFRINESGNFSYNNYTLNKCENLLEPYTKYFLATDITSNETCLNIDANNIILDCNGYSIKYNLENTNNKNAIIASRKNNIVIKNCNIEQIGPSYASDGIYFNSISKSNLINNNISILGRSSGINVYFSDNINLTNNSIETQTTSAYGVNFVLVNDSNVQSNKITTYGHAGLGISFEKSSKNKIIDNIINTYGYTSYGIKLYGQSDANIIRRNMINTNGINSDGVYISFSNDNKLNNNRYNVVDGLRVRK